MTVKELIHKLTSDNIGLTDEVIFRNYHSENIKEYSVTAVGRLDNKVILNNLYDY